MKQVVQPARGGPVRLIDVPRPTIGPTEVLVQTLVSAVSPGTERAVRKLAQSNLLAKARARPDLVRQVVGKVRTDGLLGTARTVRSRLDDDVPLGYSAAGIALEVGEAVAGISPGQIVATGGAGRANHAEFQAVPGLLCAVVPDGVPPADAAFVTVTSVALHALRLAEVGPGAKVVVIGLGLLGQLGVRLAQAAGCDVAGIDVGEYPVGRARSSGAHALVESGESTTRAVMEWSRGRGADAVLVMAASSSSAIARRAPSLCRDAASVVVVGDVGLDIDRRPYFERELTLRFARSYGPGRYERSYEDWGVDLPPGQVRWSEGRNFEAVLDLLAGGRFRIDDLVTHRFPIEEATSAYDLVENGEEPSLGILFEYPAAPRPDDAVVVHRGGGTNGPGVGMVGAGAFARTVIVPALKGAGFDRLVAVASASGLSALRLAERAGFEKAVSGADAIIDDPDVDVVVIATPHDSHARLTVQALRAGKHVFCEKPLALTVDELDEVEAARREGGGILFVGFNRRHSEAVCTVREHFATGAGPLVITYRVNAGTLPAKHWYNDRRQGGRLLGEVCHFVDTCVAVVGSDVDDVVALGASDDEHLLADDLLLGLRHHDGSLSSITYASGGHSATEKERVEVLGRGRSALILDFRSVLLDGKVAPLRHPGKGHQVQMAAFKQAVTAGDRSQDYVVSSTRTMLRAAVALGTRP